MHPAASPALPEPANLDRRLAELERRLGRTRAALGTLLLLGAGGLLAALAVPAEPQPEIAGEFRARRIVVVDEAGTPRIVLGQDPADTQRRSRAAGITIHDRHGHERGGMGTMDDGSVVLALDAPVGVGSPMRDRIGLVVWPDGSAYVMLLDNQTRAVAKLHSDGDGGGVQVFQWDHDAGGVRPKTLTYEGERLDQHPIGDGG
ncbi:MAG: hypothetical protein ACF8R7_07765 [Phycisphaerales bacterium JB039]